MGNFALSLKYMEATLEAGSDPSLDGSNAVNLGECMLNMANTNSFTGNYATALG